MTLSPVQSSGERVSELDGIRGIAIGSVLIFHFTGPYWNAHAGTFVSGTLASGWIGVDLFFVLSGYLVTRRLWQYGETRRERLSAFWRNRFLRIFPLYYLFLTLAALVDASAGWTYWVYLHNWMQPWAPEELFSYRSHLWSLAVEEQFYLAWPLVLCFVGRKAGVRLAVIATAVALVVRMGCLLEGVPAQFVYRTTLCRMDALLLGSAAALATRWPVRSSIVGGGALVLMCWVHAGGLWFDNPVVQTLGYTALAVTFAGVVRVAGSGTGGRWLRSRTLAAAGRYSYGAYLIHWPIAIWLWPTVEALDLPWPLAIGLACGEAAVVLLLAFVLYEVYEKPFLRLKVRAVR